MEQNIDCESEKLEVLLDKCFADLKAKYPYLSEAQVSKRMGMTRSTFNRIKNEKGAGRFENILRIAVGSGNPELVIGFLNVYDKDLGKKLSDVLSMALKEPDLRWEDEEMERLLVSPLRFVAYMLAALRDGTQDRQLMEVLGSSGIDAIRDLMEKGLVEEKAGRYFLKNEKNIARGRVSAKRHVQTYVEYFRAEDETPNRGYIHSLTEGVNPEGLSALHKLHMKFHREVSEIFNDERYRGEIPTFSVAFNDTFTKNNHSKRKEELQ